MTRIERTWARVAVVSSAMPSATLSQDLSEEMSSKGSTTTSGRWSSCGSAASPGSASTPGVSIWFCVGWTSGTDRPGGTQNQVSTG